MSVVKTIVSDQIFWKLEHEHAKNIESEMISIAYLRSSKLEDYLTVLSFEIFQNRFF